MVVCGCDGDKVVVFCCGGNRVVRENSKWRLIKWQLRMVAVEDNGG